MLAKGNIRIKLLEDKTVNGEQAKQNTDAIGKGRVLVVDDSQTTQLHLKKMLTDAGYTVHTAMTGKEACERAETLWPHLILLDVIMPDISGYDVCRFLKENEATRDIPVVFVTELKDNKERVKGLKLGALDYISKPVEKKILLTKAHTFVQLCNDARAIKVMHSKLLAFNKELEQFSQALDNASDAAIMTGCNGVVNYYNDAFQQLSKQPPDINHKQEVNGYFSENAVVDDIIAKALKGSAPTTEVSLKRQDGTLVPVQVKCSAILGKDQTPTGLMFLITDLTDRKVAEDERKKLEVELLHYQKLESVGQLAAGIAHEINTPIQFVGDNVQFMKNCLEDIFELHNQQNKLLEKAKEASFEPELTSVIDDSIIEKDVSFVEQELPHAIDQSLEGVIRVASVVRAMKSFAHPGMTEKAPTDINEAIRTTFTVARNEWRYVADLETDYDEELPPIPCIVSEFNQVIYNLISNASDALFDMVGTSGNKGTISVSTRQDEGWAEIRFSDTGGGIPEEIQDKIFDPFFTTKEIGNGLGQGLSVARAVIVNKHQGKFYFETEADKGTTFIIRLPAE